MSFDIYQFAGNIEGLIFRKGFSFGSLFRGYKKNKDIYFKIHEAKGY